VFAEFCPSVASLHLPALHLFYQPIPKFISVKEELDIQAATNWDERARKVITELFIKKIKEDIELPFDSGGYKLINTHFENGQSLHSQQYYFAKRFFQNTDNCKRLAWLLVEKLRELQITEPITLVGFRNYTSLFLNQATRLNKNFNYAILEQGSDPDNRPFIWQHQKELKTNLLIILPIACTCSAYVKIRNWLSDPKNLQQEDNQERKVDVRFINVFLILEESLRSMENENISIDNEKPDKSKAERIYSEFNWSEIKGKDTDAIHFSNDPSLKFVASPLIRIYADMQLPQQCPLCFTEEGKKQNPKIYKEEKPLLPTHINYESPKLILGFPNFSKVPDQQDFFKTFIDFKKTWNIHLYGHITVNNNSFLNYIRGNAFYEKNKAEIIPYFEARLAKHVATANVIFITVGNKHKSDFLEDLSLSKTFSEKSITILRYESTGEFIDNFISLYGDSINAPDTSVIYFEEVLSGGKILKLISDRIKHSRAALTGNGIRGYDAIISLVDRTLLSTKNEILKKLYNAKNYRDADQRFITFFKLNVPIIEASRLGNPLEKKKEDYNKMIADSHLDSLKMTIVRKMIKQLPVPLPEIDFYPDEMQTEEYFPFANIEKDINPEVYEFYKPYFNKERLDLLELYLIHEINTVLSNPLYQHKHFFNQFQKSPKLFIKHLLKQIRGRIINQLDNYFNGQEAKDSEFRNTKVEDEIIHDTIIKLLSRYPFSYYKNIYEAVFDYCTKKLDVVHYLIERKGVRSFSEFRKLKFYIKRSVDLNSNFIISERFIECIKKQYDKQSVDKVKENYRDRLAEIEKLYNEKSISHEYYEAALKNIRYKQIQVATYFQWLLYCFKDLINKHPYRSIKLEELLNSKKLLPDEINNPVNDLATLQSLLSSPYFHFTGMAKAENLLYLNQLKEKLKKEDFSTQEEFTGYYLDKHKNHDQKVINGYKIIRQTRFRHLEDELRNQKIWEIESSFMNMVNTLKILQERKERVYENPENDFTKNVKEILDAAIKIIQPGLPESCLNYAFFTEYIRNAEGDNDTNSIYAFISDETIDQPAAIKLRESGLIYNLLNGMTDAEGNEQTLVAALRTGTGQIIGFHESYNCKSSGTDEKLSDLYKNDWFDRTSETGLHLLTDKSNMCLIMRLAALTEPGKKTEGYELKGQSVVVITCSQPSNTRNFLDFMSNEKVRLLLLIKEELFGYLQRLFENDAFIEVVKNYQRQNLARALEHGAGKYALAINEILKTPDISRHLPILKVIWTLYNIQVSQILKANASSTNSIPEDEKEFDDRDLKSLFVAIMEAPHLARRPLLENDYTLYFDFTGIKCPEHLFYLVFSEIFLNMRKYSLLAEGDRIFKIEQSDNSIIFENTYDQETNLTPKKTKLDGGKNMCKKIIGKYMRWDEEVIKSENKYQVKLTFYK
jgi:hypothetical protein